MPFHVPLTSSPISDICVGLPQAGPASPDAHTRYARNNHLIKLVSYANPFRLGVGADDLRIREKHCCGVVEVALYLRVLGFALFGCLGFGMGVGVVAGVFLGMVG